MDLPFEAVHDEYDTTRLCDTTILHESHLGGACDIKVPLTPVFHVGGFCDNKVRLISLFSLEHIGTPRSQIGHTTPISTHKHDIVTPGPELLEGCCMSEENELLR